MQDVEHGQEPGEDGDSKMEDFFGGEEDKDMANT